MKDDQKSEILTVYGVIDKDNVLQTSTGLDCSVYENLKKYRHQEGVFNIKRIEGTNLWIAFQFVPVVIPRFSVKLKR